MTPADGRTGPPDPEAAAAPVETRIEATAGVQVAQENQEIRYSPHWRRRRALTTAGVFVALWIGSIVFIHAGQSLTAPLFLLVPLYLVLLPFILRTPKKLKRQKKAKSLGERLAWQAKVMIAVVVFLALYVPFSLFSNEVIPYAPVVEYLVFTLAIVLLLRLAGRSVGVAPSLEALPPPNHRIHHQVVAPIDDAHYQKTLWLNYAFVEKGKGQRNLAKRIDALLDANGVRADRKAEILEPLEGYRDAFTWGLSRAGRERRRAGRETRSQVLERVFTLVNRELENSA